MCLQISEKQVNNESDEVTNKKKRDQSEEDRIMEELKYKDKMMLEMNRLFTKDGKTVSKRNVKTLVKKTKLKLDGTFLVQLNKLTAADIVKIVKL